MHRKSSRHLINGLVKDGADRTEQAPRVLGVFKTKLEQNNLTVQRNEGKDLAKQIGELMDVIFPHELGDVIKIREKVL